MNRVIGIGDSTADRLILPQKMQDRNTITSVKADDEIKEDNDKNDDKLYGSYVLIKPSVFIDQPNDDVYDDAMALD